MNTMVPFSRFEDDIKNQRMEIISRRNYALKVDRSQQDKATEIKLCNFSRPHMRAFHSAWIGFNVAFIGWFAFAPLMPRIAGDLDLTKDQIWIANFCSVASTMLSRIIVGPLCDRYGGRVVMGSILIVLSIPIFIGGFVIKNGADLAMVRFLVGIVGSVFVPCQYWMISMFAREIAGSTLAIVAGWGNLGGGLSQAMMVGIYSTMHLFIEGEMAWRASFVIPALFILSAGVFVIVFNEDCPKGNHKGLQTASGTQRIRPKYALKEAVLKVDTWLLSIHYACCFGVELTMNNLLALYFNEEFNLPIVTAGLVAFLYGGMNLFARPLGGILSDCVNASRIQFLDSKCYPLRARILLHSCFLLYAGIMLVCFSMAATIPIAITILILFSFGVQCAEGTTFALVPYFKSDVTGSVSGIVGAGGSFGAVLWALLFWFGPNRYQDCFIILGVIVMASSLLSVFFRFTDFRSNARHDARVPDSLRMGAGSP